MSKILTDLVNKAIDKHEKNQAAVALGTLGGKSKSEAKAKAARLNGLKGGKPTHKKHETNNIDPNSSN